MNSDAIRNDFPVLQRRINGKPIIYLDNAATSLKPQSVISAMQKYYAEMPANVHRGLHKLSEEASRIYEESHRTVAGLIRAKENEIVFTSNATASLNLLMYSLLEGNKLDGREIVLSIAEHHANLVPWQFAAKKANAKLKFVKLKPDFTLDMDDLSQQVTSKTAIVSIAHEFNTLGTINDAKAIAKIGHEHGALVSIDAAQSIPHQPVDVKKLDADFFSFSGHKMLGPTGIGCLYGKKDLLEKLDPFLYGGSMIHSVSLQQSTWNKLPDKFEAGTPAIGEAFGLDAAVKYLQKSGVENIRNHEQKLTKLCLNRLAENKKIKVFGPKDPQKQGGIILFEIKGLGCHETALALDEADNIAIRSGMHCAEPLVSSLNPNGLCRASFYLYNTEAEIGQFADSLENIAGALA